MNVIALMGKHNKEIIKFADLKSKTINNIWGDLEAGFTINEIHIRNNVTRLTIDKVIKQRMRIKRF
tara:strand:+ start:450 stop:647 length:198 start_codon:yes stop_codon:yes gene_type:complete